jgi:hypothetical protein
VTVGLSEVEISASLKASVKQTSSVDDELTGIQLVFCESPNEIATLDFERTLGKFVPVKVMLSAPRRLRSAPGVTAVKVQSIVIGVTPVVGIPPRRATI